MVSTGQGVLSHNMYLYSNNNPINMRDSSGMIAIADIGIQSTYNAVKMAQNIAKVGTAALTQNKLVKIGFKDASLNSAIKLANTLESNNIITTEQISAFLAQCAYETNYGLWLTEIGSESYFENTAYGYKYRGAGYIQITWDYNYKDFANAMGDIEIYNQGANYVAANYAWEVAEWFWSKNDINSALINGGFDATSRKINYYDTASFAKRRNYYNSILNSW